METGRGVRLLEERVPRLVRRGQEDHPPRVRRETLDDRWSHGGGRGPEEEHRAHALQRRLEGLEHGEVARHDLDGRRELRLRRLARERAHARRQQLGDHRPPDSAGGPVTRMGGASACS